MKIEGSIIEQIEYCLKQGKRVSFLVGAGISAESGIPTFRGEGGYWRIGSKNYMAQQIGTKKFFNIAANEVNKFYLYRKSITAFAAPNSNHFMLKEIELLLKDNFALISQNVDGLHKKAGSSKERTFLIHGDHDFMRCGDDCSDELFPFPNGIELLNRKKDQWSDKESEILKCPNCREALRPHVLWFDEYYNEKFFKLDTVLKISYNTALLFVIGTSGATALPNQIVDNVIANDGFVVEVNPNETEFSEWIQNCENGKLIKSKSSPFLMALKNEIEPLV